MKRTAAVLLSALIILMTAFAAVPALAGMEVQYTTPSGYSDHDYQKLVTFLEQTDPSGVKNGKKLASNYSPTDPSTWSGITWYSSGSTKYVSYIDAEHKGLAGQLDLKGCGFLHSLSCGDGSLTSIDVSDCGGLAYLGCYDNSLTRLTANNCYSLGIVYCGGNLLTSLSFPQSTDLYSLSCMENRLTSLNFSANQQLIDLYCYDNALTSLNVSSCRSLATLLCDDNSLTALDLSNCVRLEKLSCTGNRIKSLDLSNNYMIPFDKLTADGRGYVAVGSDLFSGGHYCEAAPESGASFFGWYTEGGAYVSGSAELDNCAETRLVALFTGGSMSLRGDANHDGVIDTVDALLVLRAALGITGDAGSLLSNCDMDGDRVLDTTDALLILRLALGVG